MAFVVGKIYKSMKVNGQTTFRILLMMFRIMLLRILKMQMSQSKSRVTGKR